MLKRYFGRKWWNLKKIFYLLSSLLFLFNSFYAPLYVLAQEGIVQELQTEEISTPNPESTPITEAIPAPSPTPNLEPLPVPDPTLPPEDTPIPDSATEELPSLVPEPTPPTEPTPAPGPEPTPLIESPMPEIWAANDSGGYTTSANVVVGVTYSAPQNSKVSVTFTSLPAESGTLTIKEIKLSPEEVEKLGALSNTAYEITSTLTDNTFEYDLTLPLPPSPPNDLEIKIAESEEELANAEVATESIEKTLEMVTISGLTHFTVFVVVNPSPPPTNLLQDIIDNSDAGFETVSGTWRPSTSVAGYYGSDYVTTDDHTGVGQVRWNFTAIQTGPQEVFTRWTAAANRGTSVPFTVSYDGGPATVFVNQELNNGTWMSLGSYPFTSGNSYSVTLTNNSSSASDFVIGDAVMVQIADLVQPLTVYNTKPLAFTNDNTLDYTGTSTDDVSGIALVEYRISSLNFGDDYDWTPATPTDGAFDNELSEDFSFITPPLLDDEYDIETRATDAAGNIESTATHHVTVDTQTPTLLIAPDPQQPTVFSGWYNSDQTSTFNYTDDTSGISGPDEASCTINTEGIGQTCTVADPNICDFAGNCNNTPVTSNGADIDKTDPTDPGTPITATPTNDNTPTWDWTDSFDINLDHYVFFWDTVFGGETNGSSDLFDNLFTHSLSLADGTWYGKVKAYDIAGNFSTSDNGSVLIDTVEPTGELLINSGDTYTVSRDVSLSFPGTSGDVVEMELRNGTVGSFQSPVAFSDPYDYTLPDNGDGEYTISVRFTDAAGNKSVGIISDSITLDETPPTVTAVETVDSNGNGKLDGLKLIFSENINDDLLDLDNGGDGWDIADPVGNEQIDTGKTDNDNILVLSFGEGPTYDTANQPTVTYTPTGGPVSTHDSAGNELAGGSWVADDKALPVLLAAETQDSDNNGQIDSVKLTFSEDIDDGLLNEGDPDGWDVDSYDGEAIGTGAPADDNILLLTFTESGSLDTATTPAVSYTEGGGDTSTHDLVGNELAGLSVISTDGAAPVSSFTSPAEGSFWNEPIEISGSSTDKDILGGDDTVDYVTISYSPAGEDDWTEIEQLDNDGPEPFPWSTSWTPGEEGTYDLKVEATDVTGNTESSPQVNDVTYDVTSPTGSWVSPAADSDVNGTVTLNVTAQDVTAGVDNVVFSYSSNGIDFTAIATDNNDGDDSYNANWDTTGLTLGNYTLRAVITDNAGNPTTKDITVGVSAVVSEESGASSTYGTATITWTTDRETSSRVVYDTVSHGALGSAPNYGYAFSTGTSNTSPKVTSHAVTLTGLSNGTTYYYRTVSEGSPTAIGKEKQFQTLTTAGGGGGGDVGLVAGISTTATGTFFEQAIAFVTLDERPATSEEVLGEKTDEVKGIETLAPQEVGVGSSILNFLESYWPVILVILAIIYFLIRMLKRKNL